MTAAQRGESCAKELIHLLQAHRNLSPSSQVIVLKNTRRAGGTNRSGPVVHSGILKFNMPAVFRLVLNVLNEPFQIKIQEYLEVAVQKENGEMRGMSPCDGDVLCFYSYVSKKQILMWRHGLKTNATETTMFVYLQKRCRQPAAGFWQAGPQTAQ